MIDNRMQIEQRIFEYIGKNTHHDVKKVTQQTMLFKEGVFDSMGFVLLLDFLEEGFSIRASDEDLIEENFESVAAITDYIQRKKAVPVA
jgi:acyl carrier protein